MAIPSITSGAVLSFVVVAISTHVATSVLTAEATLVKSAITAAVTSLIWFGVTYLVSGVVGVAGYWVAAGPVLAVLAYVLFIYLSYEGGLGKAAAISVGTWVVSFGILYAAAYLGYSSFRAIGVPPGI